MAARKNNRKGEESLGEGDLTSLSYLLEVGGQSDDDTRLGREEKSVQ